MSATVTPEELDAALAASLERHLTDVPSRLAESIRYSFLAPGKRIRPRLALACSAMLGLPREAALAAASAVERVHCFTLIHDDLPCMDDDDFRRGRPSNHRQFDEATALLAGDALLALAFDALLEAEAHVPPAQVVAASRRLAAASGPRGVIGGQAAESELGPRSSLEDLRRMHAGKTGALFSAALLVPKDLAGVEGTGSRSESVDRFAAELGLAFQAIDDLDDQPAGHPAQPTSVLHYMPEFEVRRVALERLDEARRALTGAWGHLCEPLIEISEEVTSRLARKGAG
jgi:geranylgeranyl diphosphate synthase type II